MIRNRYAKYAPVHRGDILELPASAGPAAPDAPCGDGKRRGRKSAAILLSAGLALLSAFIPMNAQEAKAADTLYISGGGAGGGTTGGRTGTVAAFGGEHAASGWNLGNGIDNDSGTQGSIGGGAYVGDGTDGIPPGTQHSAGKVGSNSPGGAIATSGLDRTGDFSGGNASLSVTAGTNLQGWNIQLEGGNGFVDEDFVCASGGSATLNASSSTVATDSLVVKSGTNYYVDPAIGEYIGYGGAARAYIGTLQGTDDGNAVYAFTKIDGDLTVEIGDLDATRGNIILIVDNTAAADVVIDTLILGGNKVFDAGTRPRDGRFTVNAYDVMGSATFIGELDAAGKSMNFYLPGDMGADEKMLAVDGGSADISGSRVEVGIVGSSSPLRVGDRVVLIDVQEGGALIGAPGNDFSAGDGMIRAGALMDATFSLETTPNQLLALVESISLREESKIVSEGILAGAALATLGGDLIAGPGMAAVAGAPGMRDDGEYGLELFGVVSAGKTSYNTSPHLDISSTHLATGISRSWDFARRRLGFGAFFEYGSGSYDARGEFDDGSVRGDGSVRYVGGGVLGRMDFAENGPGRFYAEASGRAGTVRNEFNGLGLTDSFGNSAQYTSNSAYYGLHAGLGYLWDISERSLLDVYVKYFWTRINGDSVHISTGEYLEFQDVNSRRLRLGGRLGYSVNEFVSAYAGAAWEREFDGKAGGAVNGYSLDAANISGDSGVGELGLLIRPSETQPLFIDLGIQGYTGKREGVSGRLEMRWEF